MEKKEVTDVLQAVASEHDVEVIELDIPNSVSAEELLTVSKKDLKTCLQQSVIPEELWATIAEWAEVSPSADIFLEGRERIGAWWAETEASKMGFSLNFTKSEFIPSTWYPEGENWEIAQANARLKLVESWSRLLETGALERIPMNVEPSDNGAMETVNDEAAESVENDTNPTETLEASEIDGDKN